MKNKCERKAANASLSERNKNMALDLYMVGLAPQNLEKSLEFYQRLGLAIPEERGERPHIEVKMKGDLSFFLNTTPLVEEADRPRLILEFYLKERNVLEAKYNEMVSLGYQSYRAPFVVPTTNMYFAMINDPDRNIVLLSAD
jgi:hypothetical protein